MRLITHEVEQLLAKYGLNRLKPFLENNILPCIAFDLKQPENTLQIGASKLGGEPDVPNDFTWFENKGRPLDFLLQINLAQAAAFDIGGLLPKQGLLSFFYDLEDQPWGYDPKNLGGYKVVYTPAIQQLEGRKLPNPEFRLDEYELNLHSEITVPHPFARNFDALVQEYSLTSEESDRYLEFSAEANGLNSIHQHKYGGHHRLLGHSENVQGDMQLEAQLVMNGLYCGDSSGYDDPRRMQLEPDAGEWLLLLQLDSDNEGNLEWGDAGMLYYWIRKQDLAQRDFDSVWMTLQCT